MSNKRYLEIDSTYRNRELYPKPSTFEVLISQSGTRDAIHAYDPVSNASPIKTWIPDKLVLSGTVLPPADEPTNTASEFIIQVDILKNANKTHNYYSGYPIDVTTPGDIVKIFTWTYLSTTPGATDNFVVNIKPSYDIIPSGIVTFYAANVVNDFVNGTVFIPDGYPANHFYVGYILYNETIATTSNGKNNWRTIISYDGLTKIAGIDLNEGVVSPGVDEWTIKHTYSIRKRPTICRYIK